jgi:hypothetical protein
VIVESPVLRGWFAAASAIRSGRSYLGVKLESGKAGIQMTVGALLSQGAPIVSDAYLSS